MGRRKRCSFRFPQPPRSGQRVITLKDVDHAYGDLVVYRGLNFEAERGQRTVLVGPNGAGKSTLLKLLGGVLPVQAGDGPGLQCEGRLFFAVPRGDAESEAHGAGERAGYAEPGVRTDGADGARFVPVPG